MQTKFNDYFERNLIYCEETRGFIHRLYDRWKDSFPEDNKIAKYQAQLVIDEMAEEFVQKRPDLAANEHQRQTNKAILKEKEGEEASSGHTS
jgi:hypothetical protein